MIIVIKTKIFLFGWSGEYVCFYLHLSMLFLFTYINTYLCMHNKHVYIYMNIYIHKHVFIVNIMHKNGNNDCLG